MFVWFKLIELAMQARPRALGRLLHRDPDVRHAMRWYSRIGRRVWFHEVGEFLSQLRTRKPGPTLRTFLGPSLAGTEYAHDRRRPATAERVQVELIGE